MCMRPCVLVICAMHEGLGALVEAAEKEASIALEEHFLFLQSSSTPTSGVKGKDVA